MKQYSIAIESWTWNHRHDVRMWLVENFGVHSVRWWEDPDYGLDNLVMDEDVYMMYRLRWE